MPQVTSVDETEVFVLLECGTPSLGDLYPMIFQPNHPRLVAIFQHKEDFIFTATKAYKLRFIFIFEHYKLPYFYLFSFFSCDVDILSPETAASKGPLCVRQVIRQMNRSIAGRAVGMVKPR